MKKNVQPTKAIDPYKHFVCPKCGTCYSWANSVVVTEDQLLCVFDKTVLVTKTNQCKPVEVLKTIEKTKNKITVLLIYKVGCAISKIVYNSVQKLSNDKRFNIVCYEAGLRAKEIEQYNVTIFPTVIILNNNHIYKVLKNVDITVSNIEQTINKIEKENNEK